ncbi:MAG: cation:proton antiporter [Rhodospirillales bacterium]|nr:cation:proton antiporter [Rhodospirillales bacterium]
MSLFRTLGVPMRLTILVEGESLLNDATAIVAARILMSVVAGGYILTPETALGSAVEFFVVFLGGALVGAIAALIFGWVRFFSRCWCRASLLRNWCITWGWMSLRSPTASAEPKSFTRPNRAPSKAYQNCKRAGSFQPVSRKHGKTS